MSEATSTTQSEATRSPGAAGIAPVRKSIEVQRRVEDAFRIFTRGIGTWWPLDSHSVGRDKARGCEFEEKLGGEISETVDDGSRHVWGVVRAWEPPQRVVFDWFPGRGPEEATQVEVRFTAQGDSTRVDLEHRGWEILGVPAAEIRKGYDTGWDQVFGTCYAEGCV